MAQVMNKHDFCSCIETLCKYSAWEKLMYDNGLDFTGTPVAELAEKLWAAMCGFNPEWAYDKKLEFDWIIEWSFNPERYEYQTRHGRKWTLTSAEILYDFLVFMNEHGWEEDN
jgi:hypothetical protein